MPARTFYSEREFTRAVIELAKEHDWEPFHIPARVYQNEWLAPGFPDLILRYRDCEGTTTVIAAELKTDDDEESNLTDNQRAFLKDLAAHVPAFLLRYRDWNYIKDILRNGPPDPTGEIIIPSCPVIRTKELLPPDRTIFTIASKIISDLADPYFPRGRLTELRRMDPASTLKPASFWRILAERGLEYDDTSERLWALVIHGIALMTPLAHDSNIPLGQALFEGGDSNRSNAFYSNSRLNRLLTARGSVLCTLLSQMFRMLSTVKQPFDWVEMTKFILYQDEDSEESEKIRNGIARSYYRSEYHAKK